MMKKKVFTKDEIVWYRIFGYGKVVKPMKTSTGVLFGTSSVILPNEELQKAKHIPFDEKHCMYAIGKTFIDPQGRGCLATRMTKTEAGHLALCIDGHGWVSVKNLYEDSLKPDGWRVMADLSELHSRHYSICAVAMHLDADGVTWVE